MGIRHLATCAVLLAAGCAAAPQPYSYRAPEATWRMAAQNTGSYGKDGEYDLVVKPGTWKGQAVNIYAASTGAQSIMEPKNGGGIAYVAPTGQTVATFDPPIALPYPLQVGKSVTTRHRMTSVTRGTTKDVEYTCTVAAYEKVTVRAGAFDSYRVDCRYNGGNESRWVSPQLGLILKNVAVRTDESVFGPGTQKTEMVSFATPR